MALFGKIKKKKSAETEYFKQRKTDSEPNNTQSTETLLSDRLIEKNLFVDLLQQMRTHDVKSTVAVLANTTDNVRHSAAVMINKGYIPKKIVTYLQDIRLKEIEEALKTVNVEKPDQNGFHLVNDRLAAKLNLPLGCMLLGIRHRMQKEFGIILVLKQTLKDPDLFVKKAKATIYR
ncbi:hypothetical protein KKA14_09520 [bacterium]|nr:hypothetical protein [bacterium]